jgi:hypothetical protein
LGARDLHLATSLLQQAERGKPDARAMEIDEARHKKPDARLADRGLAAIGLDEIHG